MRKEEEYGKIIKIIAGYDGYNAQRTLLDLPIIKKVIEAVKSTSNDCLFCIAAPRWQSFFVSF